jgi:hypothetical protein
MDHGLREPNAFNKNINKLLLNGPPIAYKNETATCHKAQVSTFKKFFADITLMRKVSRINPNQ